MLLIFRIKKKREESKREHCLFAPEERGQFVISGNRSCSTCIKKEGLTMEGIKKQKHMRCILKLKIFAQGSFLQQTITFAVTR